MCHIQEMTWKEDWALLWIVDDAKDGICSPLPYTIIHFLLHFLQDETEASSSPKLNIYEYCLCPYCQNIKYKLMALKHAKRLLEITPQKETLVEAIICLKVDKEYCGAECISGECNQCSDWDQKLEEICSIEKKW